MWKDNFDPTATAAPEINTAIPDDLGSSVATEIYEQFGQNAELQDALIRSGLPRRFQAMVLGLATLKQMNGGR